MRSIVSLLLASTALGACVLDPAVQGAAAPANDSAEIAPEVATEPVLEVIATGANIAGANGIHFGPDGLLYITSVIGSDLTVINPDTGEELKRFTAADGVIGPDDVAFASDGSYYWTSILTGEVAGFTPNGDKIIAAQLPPGPNPITFSDDDRLFVSQCFLGTNVYELDPQGVEPPRLIADDLGPGCGLNGMDWGPDDRLYGPRWFTGEVVSLDVETGARRIEATGFQTPAAIKFDSTGRLHVLDTGRGELVRLDGDTREVVATLSPGLDNFAFDAADTPFVSSFTDGFIKRVNADGSITSLQPGGMAHPGGLGVMGDTVWVADVHAIRGFDRITGEEIITQRNIVGVGALGGSINLSVDGDQLILTSWFDGDVRIWDPASEQRLAHYANLAGPVAAVRYADGLAIAEHLKGGVFLYGEGEPAPLATGLPAPTGLFAKDGALYVSDRARGEILIIARNGAALETPEVVASGLAAPEGFVVSAQGIVVVEADPSHLTHIAADGTRNHLADLPIGSPGAPGLPPSQIFNGVTMDEDGNLFISGEADRVLYRIKAPWAK
jgi:sugar lactone lactonase YvrE